MTQYRITHPSGLPGLGKEAGMLFEADPTRADIDVLLKLGQIEEVEGGPRRTPEPPPQPAQTDIPDPDQQKSSEAEDDSEDTRGGRRRGGRHSRRDMRAED